MERNTRKNYDLSLRTGQWAPWKYLLNSKGLLTCWFWAGHSEKAKETGRRVRPDLEVFPLGPIQRLGTLFPHTHWTQTLPFHTRTGRRKHCLSSRGETWAHTETYHSIFPESSDLAKGSANLSSLQNTT